MSRHSSMVSLLFVGALVLSLFGSYVEGLGVNWGTKATHQLPPDMVVQMLKDNGINKVKLFDADPTILDALEDTDIEVMVAVTNVELDAMTNKTNAEKWVKDNVVKYVEHDVKITSVAVGNEPFLVHYKNKYINSTLPALQNIQKALDDAKLGDKIKASVPLNGDVYMSPPWKPIPSAGLFRPDVSDQVEDIADFLGKNNAPFIINIYPFFSLMEDDGFPIDYAFFDGADGIKDGDVEYKNMFDASYDTCVSALKQIGHGNMTIIIGEIGWPTDGNKWANSSLASRFYNGFLPRMAEHRGTPLYPHYIEVYLFGLLDEDAKSILPGYFERHWGIFDYAGQPKFNMSLGEKDNNKTLVGAENVKFQSKKWCVLKPHETHDEKQLDDSMVYACDRADCTAFGDGGSCSSLPPCEKTSYAMNAFFQVSNQSKGSCDFGGLATEVDEDPSKDQCKFNIQIKHYEPGSDWDSESPSPSWFSSSHFTVVPRVALISLSISVMTSLFFF